MPITIPKDVTDAVERRIQRLEFDVQAARAAQSNEGNILRAATLLPDAERAPSATPSSTPDSQQSEASQPAGEENQLAPAQVLQTELTNFVAGETIPEPAKLRERIGMFFFPPASGSSIDAAWPADAFAESLQAYNDQKAVAARQAENAAQQRTAAAATAIDFFKTGKGKTLPRVNGLSNIPANWVIEPDIFNPRWQRAMRAYQEKKVFPSKAPDAETTKNLEMIRQQLKTAFPIHNGVAWIARMQQVFGEPQPEHLTTAEDKVRESLFAMRKAGTGPISVGPTYQGVGAEGGLLDTLCANATVTEKDQGGAYDTYRHNLAAAAKELTDRQTILDDTKKHLAAITAYTKEADQAPADLVAFDEALKALPGFEGATDKDEWSKGFIESLRAEEQKLEAAKKTLDGLNYPSLGSGKTMPQAAASSATPAPRVVATAATATSDPIAEFSGAFQQYLAAQIEIANVKQLIYAARTSDTKRGIDACLKSLQAQKTLIAAIEKNEEKLSEDQRQVIKDLLAEPVVAASVASSAINTDEDSDLEPEANVETNTDAQFDVESDANAATVPGQPQVPLVAEIADLRQAATAVAEIQAGAHKKRFIAANTNGSIITEAEQKSLNYASPIANRLYPDDGDFVKQVHEAVKNREKNQYNDFSAKIYGTKEPKTLVEMYQKAVGIDFSKKQRDYLEEKLAIANVNSPSGLFRRFVGPSQDVRKKAGWLRQAMIDAICASFKWDDNTFEGSKATVADISIIEGNAAAVQQSGQQAISRRDNFYNRLRDKVIVNTGFRGPEQTTGFELFPENFTISQENKAAQRYMTACMDLVAGLKIDGNELTSAERGYLVEKMMYNGTDQAKSAKAQAIFDALPKAGAEKNLTGNPLQEFKNAVSINTGMGFKTTGKDVFADILKTSGPKPK